VLRCLRELRTWKSGEDAASCADVAAADEAFGLFALSDGVSRSPYPELWARALVEQFCTDPLLSSDAREVRRWLMQAAARRAVLLPPAAAARSVSAATLVAARILAQYDDGVQIEVLAVGDACALWQSADTAAVAAFPLTDPAAFAADPDVLCSDDAAHPAAVAGRIRRRELFLPHGTTLMLASDALAAFLLQPDRPAGVALRQLGALDPADWPGLVRSWRRALPPLADDDTTALILQVDSPTPPQLRPVYELPAVQQRIADLRDAAAAGQLRRIAELAGDGTLAAAVGLPLDAELVRRARAAADGFEQLRTAFNSWLAARRSPLEADCAAALQHLLQCHAAVLEQDPSAETLLTSLAGFGFRATAAVVTRPLAAALTQPLPVDAQHGEAG
jgi:hypothetical protein